MTTAHGVPVTTPARTAVDLACERPLPEPVVALDAFLAARRTTVDALVALVDDCAAAGVSAQRGAHCS